MNNNEKQKFDQILSDGYSELISVTPTQPIQHFIYFLINNIPIEQLEKNKKLHNFYQEYRMQFRKFEDHSTNI